MLRNKKQDKDKENDETELGVHQMREASLIR